MALVLMDPLQSLQSADVTVTRVDAEPRAGTVRVDAVIELASGGVSARFAVEARRRAPYPNELAQLEGRRRVLERYGQPLLVTTYVSEPLGALLANAGWSWADAQGNYDLRAPGLRLRQRRSTGPLTHRRRELPGGTGGWAIIRALIGLGRAEQEPGATALATRAGVSQPRASQVLSALRALGLVERTRRGRWHPDRTGLLDRFLAEYPGPGGTERFLYSLDAPSDVAMAAAGLAGAGTLAVSADVGPDLVAPWRRPSVVILYAVAELPLDRLGLVEAQGSHDANVFVRVPLDRSVFPNPLFLARAGDVEVPLADPTQMLWDLHELGGTDRLEAAERLRRWLIDRP